MSKYRFLSGRTTLKTLNGCVGKKIAINTTVVPQETKAPKAVDTAPVPETVAKVVPETPAVTEAPVVESVTEQQAPVANSKPVVNEGPVPTMFDVKTRAVPTFGGEVVSEEPVAEEQASAVDHEPVMAPAVDTIASEISVLKDEVANNDMVPRENVLKTLMEFDEALGMVSASVKNKIALYKQSKQKQTLPLPQNSTFKAQTNQNSEEEQMKLAA